MKYISILNVGPFYTVKYRIKSQRSPFYYDTEILFFKTAAEAIICKHALIAEYERRIMSTSFVDRLIEFTKESETPTSFWKWGAYAIVAATLRDNVYWTIRGNKICPNIYVLLNADSAVHRKSNPINEANRLLSEVKSTKLIRGRGSIQAILEELGAAAMDKETGKAVRGGSCLLVADELKSFFVGDDALIGLLTDIYDYRDRFEYRLRGNGFIVKNLCVSMLAGSNDEFLKTVYTGEAVFGGLLGRTFLVKADEYRPGNSLLELENEEEINRVKYDIKPLVDQLKDIAKLAGKIRFDMQAKTHYDNWYLNLRKTYEKKPDRTGVLGRMHMNVVKIAVILAISRRNELIVRKGDMEDAISDCINLIPNYDGFAMSVGKSNEANVGSLLMNAMWQNGGKIARASFLEKYWYDCNSDTLDKVIGTLTEAGFIEVDHTSGGVIWMTKKCKDIFSKQETIQ